MFLCITILGPPPQPRQVPSHAICGPTKVRFLAYYMGAPSDQFLHLLWRPTNYVFFLLYMGAPRIISLHTILGPTDHFLCLLYGAPQISFFSFNMGAPLRSVLLFTIWGPPSDQFICML